MPEFLTAPFSSLTPIAPLEVLTRLVMAVVLGGIVAWIYKRTRPSTSITASFPGTLVLLAVLIAMVTQVIGDSVARAFSLVGALSIVRFRTVVRDTQDTAFVIFAVVVGMAVGASDPRVALIGIAVVGAAAFMMRNTQSTGGESTEGFSLKVRLAMGHDRAEAIARELDTHVTERRVTGVSTAKQGIALDMEYYVQLRKDRNPDEVVRALNRIDGVQSVEISARTSAENPF